MTHDFFPSIMKHTAAILTSVLLAATGVEAKPLKVFILAGQSNMEGHAKIETFDYIGDDPATAPLLKKMRGPDGKPAVADHTWISYLTGHYEGRFLVLGKRPSTTGRPPHTVSFAGMGWNRNAEARRSQREPPRILHEARIPKLRRGSRGD